MNGAPDFGAMPLKDQFMELMADSAQAVINHFGKHITFITVSYTHLTLPTNSRV